MTKALHSKRQFCNLSAVVNFQVLLSPTSWHQKLRKASVTSSAVLWRLAAKVRIWGMGYFFHLGLNKILKFVSGSNPCQKNNGGCGHLCLYRRRGVKCECPDGMEILADKKSCICKCIFALFSMEIVTWSDIWNVSYIELRILKSSELWSSQLWTQFKQLRIEAWKSQKWLWLRIEA